MATFEIEHNGRTFEVEAPDMQAAASAIQSIGRPSQKPNADMSFMGRLKDNVVGVDDGVESAGEYLANMLNKGGQGLSFGFGDEADAAVRSLANGKSYDQNLKDYRSQEAEFEKAHPVASTLAEIGGAVLPVAAGVGVGVNTVRGGIAMGAGQGAAHGFGNGEGGVQARANQSALGLLMGGAIGGAVPAAAKGVQSLRSGVMARGAVKEAAKGAPTSEQLRATGNAAYQEIDDAGAQISPKAFEDARRKIVDRLRSETGFDELPGPGSLTPNSARVSNIMEQASERMASEPTAALPFKSLDQMRRQAGAAAGNVANKTDQQAGATIIEGLDDFVKGIGFDDVVSGDVQALKAAIPKAREIWGRMSRSQLIDDAIEQEGNYLSGGASAIRNQFSKILKSPKLSRGFSEAEKKAMRRVVQGTPSEWLVNTLGGGLGGLTQIGLGASAGGLPGAALGMATAAGTRKLSESIVRKNAEIARAAIASGKLQGTPQLPPPSALQILMLDAISRGGNAGVN